MRNWIKQPFWIAFSLAWGFNQLALAEPCIRLAGVVEDYASHRPLLAQLFIKTQKGQYRVGTSAAQTGQFSVDITCPATMLVIEKAGYRPQMLLLNTSSLHISKLIGVIIPMVAIDQPGMDRPYFQTEQTHFVQKNSRQGSIPPQHNTFIISDALTGQFLNAQTCFFFTKSGHKKCIDSDSQGRFSIDFVEKDIVALEVAAPGYQTYQGNMVVEQEDRRQLQHNVRLTRALTLLSVQLSTMGGSCQLRPEAGDGKPIALHRVPGLGNTFAAYDLLPQPYMLLLFDQTHVLVEQKLVTIQAGLNVFAAQPGSAKQSVTQVAGDPAVPSASQPDSALRFEQGSYNLLPSAKVLLAQMAAYLQQHPDVNIRISGHTDKEGNEQLNRQLSEFRAKVVSTFLGQRGVADQRMEIVGFGSRYLIAPSDTEENKARNRRVTIKFLTN